MGSRENEYDSDSDSEESDDKDYVPPANINRHDGSDDESDDEDYVAPPPSVPVTSVSVGPHDDDSEFEEVDPVTTDQSTTPLQTIPATASVPLASILKAPNSAPDKPVAKVRRVQFDEPNLRIMITKTLKVFSVAMLPKARPELENGGKLILPPSFLEPLQREGSNLNGPMLFKVTHDETQNYTHSGVLEFIAEEGKCYMPSWRMRNIGANNGDFIVVRHIPLPLGTFALFEPQSADFEDITDPKAMMEVGLRNFACLTKGELIIIRYNNKIYELKILETKPADAVCIIDCDLVVGFNPPAGPKPNKIQRLDPMQINFDEIPAPRNLEPDYDWKVGTLEFKRNNGLPIKMRSTLEKE